MTNDELKSEFLFDMELNINAPQLIGPVLTGTRIIIPVEGGSIQGEKINGKVLTGSDWGLNVGSTTFKMDCRTTIETDDGALIYITYSGYFHAEAEKFAFLSEGRTHELAPSDYYLRSVPIFETSFPKYSWLNHTVSIGIGYFPAAGKIVYRIYAIK